MNFYGNYKCDFKVFCKDKPGKEGILLRTLADCEDRYISRVIPYSPLAPNQEQNTDITHSLVMDIATDILGTGRNLCGDRFYSSVKTAEALQEKRVTYVGTIMPNRAGLPLQLKTVKDRDIESSLFMWKKDSPVMGLSYQPKKGKNVLFISTQHSDPDVEDSAPYKPRVVLDYNEYRCGVDIVNKMVKEYKSLPKNDSWWIVIFSFVVDLAVVNGSTILKYNMGNNAPSRRDFLRKLCFQLCLPWVNDRLKAPNLHASTVSAIKSVLELKEQLPPILTPTLEPGNEPTTIQTPRGGRKCATCIANLKDLKNNVRRKAKGNLNPMVFQCTSCQSHACGAHRAGDKCSNCASVIVSFV